MASHFLAILPLTSIADQLYTIASSRSHKLVATACKASTAEHAVVLLYDTQTWRPFGQPLQGHELTVTRIAFSPDDRYILTVSRDRTFCLFELADGRSFRSLVSCVNSYGFK